MNKLSRDDLFLAVKEGVKEAILTMTESGDGFSGPTIRDPFLKAIEDGIKAATAAQLQEDKHDKRD